MSDLSDEQKLICDKCNVLFVSEKKLEIHKNRKITCDKLELEQIRIELKITKLNEELKSLKLKRKDIKFNKEYKKTLEQFTKIFIEDPFSKAIVFN